MRAGAATVAVPAALAGFVASFGIDDGSMVGPLLYICCGPAVAVTWAAGAAGGAIGGCLGWSLGWGVDQVLSGVDKGRQLITVVKDKWDPN